MPPYARPSDVVFDHGAAATLLSEIRLTVSVIGRGRDQWEPAAIAALADWSGRLARTYDLDLTRWQRRLDEIVTELGAMSMAVHDAVDAATTEHLRIASLQAEWDREAAREARADEEGD